MSAPGGAPSPAPRSGSMGPNGNGMPMSSQPSLSGTPVHAPPTPGPSQPQSGAMSQQNLNQICASAGIDDAVSYSQIGAGLRSSRVFDFLPFGNASLQMSRRGAVLLEPGSLEIRLLSQNIFVVCNEVQVYELSKLLAW
ncbi:hypothetical protein N7492_002330 [Penicillium capsulatum]|uniref:Uncharacterized protein n=1 Tax=Penicillium capsulatum TaxID=69766 RepID=A0A9W9IIC9_9EURO|nr:hypothetical protein N7492_002330 [Penicillium capsulatum]